MKKFCSYLTATWFGLGFSPKASGTCGSLGALPFVYLIFAYSSREVLFIASIALFFLGVAATNFIIKSSEDKDPSLVVIDEVVGQMLTFSLVWHSLTDWKIYVLGFILFRFFDIYKMGPVKFFDSRIHNAWGVMLDDVFAGILAAICLYLGNFYLF